LNLCSHCLFEVPGPPICDHATCAKCRFHADFAQVEVLVSNIPDSGRGLFCKVEAGFKANTKIAEFTGSIVAKKDFETASSHPNQQHIELTFQAIELKDGKILIADEPECPARYANCSKTKNQKENGTPKNNCKLVTTTNGAFLTTDSKAVPFAAELYMSYGTGYWKAYDKDAKKAASQGVIPADSQLAFETNRALGRLFELVHDHPLFLVDENALDYNPTWRATDAFTKEELEEAKKTPLPMFDPDGFYHCVLPPEQHQLFSELADNIVTQGGLASALDWGDQGWMAGRMVKIMFADTEWKFFPMTDNWTTLTQEQKDENKAKIVSSSFQPWCDIVRSHVPKSATKDLNTKDVKEQCVYLGALNIGGSAMPHADYPELPDDREESNPGTGPGAIICNINLNQESLLGFTDAGDDNKGSWSYLLQKPGTMTMFWGKYRNDMFHTVLNLETDSNGCYPLVTAENAKSLRQSMTFRLFTSNPDSFMKSYVVDQRSPEPVSPARIPNSRPVRQTSKIKRLILQQPQYSTPKSGSSKSGSKKPVVNEAVLDLTKGSVNPSEIEVRGWEVEQPAKKIRIASIDSAMSVVIVKALRKQDHSIRRWNGYLTYQHQLALNLTLEWHCVVLAVGVVTFLDKTGSKAFALVALRSLVDDNIAEWTAPSWISSSRLLPRANLFTTDASTKVNRPKRFDTDAKVDALLKQGVWNEKFREQHWFTTLAFQITAERPAAPKSKKQKTGVVVVADLADPGQMVVVSKPGLELPLSPSKSQPWQQNQSIQILAQQMLAAQQMQQQMLAAQHSQWVQFPPMQQQMQSGQQQQQVASIRQAHDVDTKEELKFAREAQIVAAQRAHEALMVAMKAGIQPSSVASVTIVPAADLSPAVPKPPSTEEVISTWLKLNGIAHAADVVSKLVDLGVCEGVQTLMLDQDDWANCGFLKLPIILLQKLKAKQQ
jgi:hypothetical protein